MQSISKEGPTFGDIPSFSILNCYLLLQSFSYKSGIGVGNFQNTGHGNISFDEGQKDLNSPFKVTQ